MIGGEKRGAQVHREIEKQVIEHQRQQRQPHALLYALNRQSAAAQQIDAGADEGEQKLARGKKAEQQMARVAEHEHHAADRHDRAEQIKWFERPVLPLAIAEVKQSPPGADDKQQQRAGDAEFLEPIGQVIAPALKAGEHRHKDGGVKHGAQIHAPRAARGGAHRALSVGLSTMTRPITQALRHLPLARRLTISMALLRLQRHSHCG